VQERVEAADLVQVEADEGDGGQAAVAEAGVDGLHGGLVELEAGAGAADQSEHGSEDEQRSSLLRRHGVVGWSVVIERQTFGLFGLWSVN
jgi:hypothetical protein